MKKALLFVLAACFLFSWGREGKEVTVLYWNIQNGMWHDQGADYDNFVAFVKETDPDICIWSEAASRYVTDTCIKMQIPEGQYLPWNWDILAGRYGHKYVLVCGERDTFPQVITSKYPLRIVRRLTGNGEEIVPDKDVVAIGSGGNYAYSAAVALYENTDLDAESIVRKSLEIASNICVYTNNNITVEKL